MHLIKRDFVENLTSSDNLKLPWHRADKKIPYIDREGNTVAPAEPNGVKLESFIFDALPLAEKTMIMEFDRSEVFGPTKNPTGVDSAESCRQMLMERDAKRLERAGVTVPRNADGSLAVMLEISPLKVLDDEDAVLFASSAAIALQPGQKVELA